MSSSKASDKNQEEHDEQLVLQHQYKMAPYKEVTEEIKQQLQDQYEELESSGFPEATTEDDRIDKWWLLVNTEHIPEAREHYGKHMELESQSNIKSLINSFKGFNVKKTSSAPRPSARIQSTISKHSASSAPRPSASSSPSPYHNRRSTRPSTHPSTRPSTRRSTRPSRINEENYQNIENWHTGTNKNGENIYRFVDPENGYTEDAILEKYKKIMGILPPNPNTGGSRKRSRRHSKKQKRVRHTRRKQTRRHRHRHSRHSRHRR